MRREAKDWLVVAASTIGVFLLLGYLSFSATGVAWNYLLGVLLTMAIYALFALGLSLEFGYTGLLNFGHVGFMAIGAYGVAVLFERWHRSGLHDLIAGATFVNLAVCLLLALVLGAAALVPLLTLLERTPLRRRHQIIAAYSAAALVAVASTLALFPLSERGAQDALVYLAVLAALASAAAGGLLLGLPTVRLREDYLAIVTIGAAEILRSVSLNEDWLTHGTLGFPRLHRPVQEWALRSEAWSSFARSLGLLPVALAETVLALVVLAFAYLLLQRLSMSPWGRVLRAIREDEDVAVSLGKNTTWFKLQSLMLGSAIAASAGILLAWRNASVFPENFVHALTFFAFIVLILGGYGNHRGALVGAVLLWGIFEAARNLRLAGLGDLAGPPQQIAIGLLLILAVLFRPQGLIGRKEELVHAR